MPFLRLSVDGNTRTDKTVVVVGPEEKAQLAENIRTGRARLNLTRVQFAQAAGISTNTLRALETASHARLPDHATLDKIARVLHTTAGELYRGALALTLDDPILAGLNREDLAIARAFHDAILEAKTAVHRLLKGALTEERRDRVAVLIRRLLDFDAESLEEIDHFLGSLETGRLPHTNQDRKKTGC